MQEFLTYIFQYSIIPIQIITSDNKHTFTLKAKDINSEVFHTIIDAGINVGEDGKLRGDFCKEDYSLLDEKDIAYTTVPGGVGPITTHMLGYNLYKAYCLQNNIEIS